MVAHQIGLIFHGIGTPKRSLAPGEARYWISRDQYMRCLDQIVALPDPKRVCITFDDGNLSDLEIGLPLLRDRGLEAIFFVLSDRIGQKESLGAEDIRFLVREGMQVGSHGKAHLDWRLLNPSTLQDELFASRAALEDVCGYPITQAAIPFGGYNARVLRALTAAGYDRIYSSDGGWMRGNTILKPRTSIRHDMEPRDITALLSGYFGIVRQLRRTAAMTVKQWF